MKSGNNVKIIPCQKNSNDKNIKYNADYIGKVSLSNKEEYTWEYNNYFEKNKFTKPYENLDWIVIGSTKFFSSNFSKKKYDGSYKLSVGDFFKLGKITFLVRKIKKGEINNSNSYDSLSNNENNNSNFNLNNNFNNSINQEYIHDEIHITRKNSIKTNNDANENEQEKNDLLYTDSINNKLKILYLKVKDVNEKIKNKPINCRFCFSEGQFDGDNPLISPCSCTGSVKYIHLNCLRKWLTSKVTVKSTSNNNIYCYIFKNMECELCKCIIPERVKYRDKYISLLDFKEVKSPYIILQTMSHYNMHCGSYSEYNVIFVLSFKYKNYMVIGRANESDIRLSDISVSRNHSILSYYNGDFFLDDIGSKFGTLLLIQNNILFLPYKEISIQTGRFNLMFYLIRTFFGCFKCYKNKIYDKLTYEQYINSHDKLIYLQILDSLKNNVIDPIEKFSSIGDSVSSKSYLNDDDNNTENNVSKSINDEKDNSYSFTCKNNDDNNNSLIEKQQTKNLNGNNKNNTTLKNIDCSNNIINYDNGFFVNEVNDTYGGNIILTRKKNDESNLMLTKNEDFNDSIEKKSVMDLMTMKILNKKSASVLNIKKNNLAGFLQKKINNTFLLSNKNNKNNVVNSENSNRINNLNKKDMEDNKSDEKININVNG